MAPRLLATRKAEQNRAVVDPWTVVHLSTGLALGLIDFPLRWALTGAALYEIVEQYAERKEWGKEFFRTSGPEDPLNAVMDLAVLAAGHELGRRWNRTGRR